MTATNQFFAWFYTGLGGLGGWLLFLLFALIAVIWLIYNSATRNIRAIGWRMAAIITAAFLFPSIIFRFSSAEIQRTLAPFVEWIFYLGLLGGLIPPVIAVGYFVTYQGVTGGKKLPSSKATGQYAPPPIMPAPLPTPASPIPTVKTGAAVPEPPPKPKANAWLVGNDGRSHQLFQGDTTIGRSARNDVQISDSTVSREHCKIVEQNGRFRLFDLGGKNGTRVNNRLVRQPVMLEPDDTIQVGDNTQLRFVTGGQ